MDTAERFSFYNSFLNKLVTITMVATSRVNPSNTLFSPLIFLSLYKNEEKTTSYFNPI